MAVAVVIVGVVSGELLLPLPLPLPLSLVVRGGGEGEEGPAEWEGEEEGEGEGDRVSGVDMRKEDRNGPTIGASDEG